MRTHRRHRVHHPRRHRRLPRRRATTRTPAGPSRTSSSTRPPTSIKGRETEQATALLFGRQSYDEFAPVWPSMEEFATYNAMPKYVVSTTLPATPAVGRQPGHVLRSLDEVAALKETEGGEIHVHGSPTLAQGLAAAGLVDRYHLLVFPLLLGSGKRLFADGPPRQDQARAHRARRLLQRDHPPGLRRRALSANALA